LMAGDVSKIQQAEVAGYMRNEELAVSAAMPAPVSEKAFEDYHLYTPARPATLRDRETKQVEFIRASGVKSERIYVYDGMKIDWNQWRGVRMENIRNNQDLGTEMETKVAVMREFKNSEANHLGMPLPKGRLRFYKQDEDKQLEFTGENLIDHTPRDETLRVFTGNAFDLVGERRRTNVKADSSNHWLDETFEIKLRNHKKEPVDIRVVEHLFRWTNWEIREKSDPFTKMNAQTMEFRVPVKADEEKTIHYTVHYSWELPNWALRLVIVSLLIGFPIALILAWAFDVTPQGIKTTPTTAVPGAHRRRNVIMLVATGVIISAAAGFFLLPRAVARKIDKSIAVLPFENLSDDKENAYFADGVQDDVLTNLSKIGDLKVISRTSVMQYRGKMTNVREIGKALGVSNILEGSVRRSGNKVRVNVQLIDANNDEHIWASDY